MFKIKKSKNALKFKILKKKLKILSTYKSFEQIHTNFTNTALELTTKSTITPSGKLSQDFYNNVVSCYSSDFLPVYKYSYSLLEFIWVDMIEDILINYTNTFASTFKKKISKHSRYLFNYYVSIANIRVFENQKFLSDYFYEVVYTPNDNKKSFIEVITDITDSTDTPENLVDYLTREIESEFKNICSLDVNFWFLEYIINSVVKSKCFRFRYFKILKTKQNIHTYVIKSKLSKIKYAKQLIIGLETFYFNFFNFLNNFTKSKTIIGLELLDYIQTYYNYIFYSTFKRLSFHNGKLFKKKIKVKRELSSKVVNRHTKNILHLSTLQQPYKSIDGLFFFDSQLNLFLFDKKYFRNIVNLESFKKSSKYSVNSKSCYSFFTIRILLSFRYDFFSEWDDFFFGVSLANSPIFYLKKNIQYKSSIKFYTYKKPAILKSIKKRFNYNLHLFYFLHALPHSKLMNLYQDLKCLDTYVIY